MEGEYEIFNDEVDEVRHPQATGIEMISMKLNSLTDSDGELAGKETQTVGTK